MEQIRTLRPDDSVKLQRMLERCFGHGFNWFLRNQPDLFGNEPDLLEAGLVIEANGALLCHVATYPMELQAGLARLACGGIGNVATVPEARGKGYMSQLLEASVARMQARGWPLSVLWGDPQRYGWFGYTPAGYELLIDISQRGLAGMNAADVEEVDPASEDAAARVEGLYKTLPYRTDRPYFTRRLRRPNLRLFLGSDGYVITGSERSGNPTILELASPTGRELELILAVLEITRGSRATVIVEPEPSPRVQRLLEHASSWSFQAQGLFRIVDWPAFLTAVLPALQEKTADLKPFKVSIGARWNDSCPVMEVEWDGERLEARRGRDGACDVELDVRRLTRLMLGAPAESCPQLGPFQRLLPVTVHIPRLDHV